MTRKHGRVARGRGAVARPPLRAVVTIGVFDGVHLAHQQLIRATVALARRLRGTSVVMTFDPDPQRVLHPAKAQPSLMPLSARLAHLRQRGVDLIWIIPFTTRFSRLTARRFVQRLLIRRLRARAVVLGERFMFGRNRQGTMELLRAIGSSHGLRVVTVREVRVAGASVSSSRIRALIAAGRLAGARRLLGRAPELYGVVVRGVGRGRRLGFRTANLRLTSQVLPPRGVYAVVLRPDDRRRSWRGVMNLGVRPTFGAGPEVCEVHLLGFAGTLLGRHVTISLVARLRGERRFPNPAALSAQVRKDVRAARRLFRRASSAFSS